MTPPTPKRPIGRMLERKSQTEAATAPEGKPARARLPKATPLESPTEAAARVRAANAAARKANPGNPGVLERPAEAAARARAALQAARAAAAATEAPAPRAPGRVVAPDPQIALLKHRIDAQARQIASLRAKSLDMQLALIQGRPVCDFGDPLAAITPIERRLVPGAETTIFAFSGMITSFGMPPREFFGALSARPANIFFVKDFHQCWYQQGILGLSENIPDTAQALGALIPPGQTRVITIGTSAGGFGAILFGALMGCDLAVAFSPQTLLTTDTVEAFKSTQSPDTQDMVKTSQFKDLAVVLKSAPPKFRVDLHYGTKHAKDTAAAERLGRIPSVNLIAHDLPGHPVAGTLKQSGKLQAILDQAVTG